MNKITLIKKISLIILLFLTLILRFQPQIINIKAKENNNIEFLAFSTLMAFPEKALDKNNNLSSAYDETKITINEFNNILNELYENNCILIDIYDLIDKDSMTLKEISTDKKPIVFIFNNVFYKSNYQNLGEIDKLIIDRNNNLASYTTKKSIQDRVQYENEFELILEKFIKSHPDFSYNNARGIIFLTGENGILGYKTNHKNAGYKYESKKVAEVIKKLKNLGWKFGSNNYYSESKNTVNNLEFAKDISLWNQEVKSLIGNTNLYSFNSAETKEDTTQKIELLLTNGFDIFFEISNESSIEKINNYFQIKCKNVNGYSLRNSNNIFNNLFDCETVYDHENRQIEYSNDNNNL